MTSLFSIQVQLTDTTPVFNGYFEVDDTTHVIQHFYDTSNISVDILDAPGLPNGGDNLYESGWASFSFQGCNITSFPYFFGSTSSNYDLYGTVSTSSSSGRLYYIDKDVPVDLVYQFASIGAIPAPTAPIAQLANSLYSIQLQLRTTAPIFNGYFETDVFNKIQHFYDTSDINTDILSTGTYANADYIYQPGWLSLSNGGTNLISFAAIGSSSTDFNVAGQQAGGGAEGSQNIGAILYNNSTSYVLFVITAIGSAPAPTDPIPATVLYSVQVKTSGSFTILNAYFESELITGLIQHFYDTTDSTTIVTDIHTTPSYFLGANNVYQGPGSWLSFSNDGITISTFPFLGASNSEFLLRNPDITDGSTNANQVIWNSEASSQRGIVAFQYITSIPAPTGPIGNPTLFSIQLTAGSTVIFNGYFEIDGTNLIQHFYDTSDSTTIVTDILSSGTWSNPDNLYQYSWGSFSTNGVNITSFPYYSLISTGDWHITGSGDANTAGFVTAQTGPIMPRLAAAAPVTFSIGAIYSAPAPTGPITPYSPPAPPSGVVCFKEGSKILTDKGYKPIQELRKGDLVQTSKNGYKAIFMIGKRDIEHIGSEERIKDQLYSCKQEQYPELLEELVITGCHSILVSDFKEGERERTRDVNGRIFVTDNKYRLPACVDMRASVYDKKGVHTIYHIALENDDYYMNYGVYANGLLVETCSKRYLKELSNMELF